MNTKGYIVISFVVGVSVALASYIFASRKQPEILDAPINKPPGLLGKLTNPNGGAVEVFEMTGTPPSVYCVIAVSSAIGNASLYPVVSCLKR